MPRIRPGMKKPPPGFEIINEKLDEYEDEMKLALQEESNGVMGRTTRQQTEPHAPLFRRGGTEEEEEEQHHQHHKRPRGDRDDATAATTTDAVKRTKVDIDEEAEEKTEAVEGAPHTQQTSDTVLSSTSIEQSKEGEEGEGPIPPLWKIARINHNRTRFVFDAYARKKIISKEVFDYCVDMQFIDGGLARRWRLPGYERLCCTACGTPGGASIAAGLTSRFALRDKLERKPQSQPQKSHHNSSSDTAVCLCRVPIEKRKNKSFMACTVCGCKGCCSSSPPSASSAHK